MPIWRDRGSKGTMATSTRLDPDQLEQLESFLKDWLRHSGRTQSDLRRALRAGSIRMPVLLARAAAHRLPRRGHGLG